MKQGENEAKTILEKFGIEFDPIYEDKNIGKSMPDLKYKDGRYLEVTHTRHNKAIFTSIGDFWKKSSQEQCEIIHSVSNALERYNKLNYEMGDGKLSEKGQKQYREDLKLLKKQYGDFPNICRNVFEVKFSEFKCNTPIIQFSSDNILDEIVKDKGSKYPDGNTDLFLFVTEEEFNVFITELKQYEWNRTAQCHIKMILASPFSCIYLCIWNIYKQEYEIDNPTICKLKKTKDGGVCFTKLRNRSSDKMYLFHKGG